MADDKTPGQHNNGDVRPGEGESDSPVTVQGTDREARPQDAPTVSISPIEANQQGPANRSDQPEPASARDGDAEESSGDTGDIKDSSPWARPDGQATASAPPPSEGQPNGWPTFDGRTAAGQPGAQPAQGTGGYQQAKPYSAPPGAGPPYQGGGQPGYPTGQAPVAYPGVPPYPGAGTQPSGNGFSSPPGAPGQPGVAPQGQPGQNQRPQQGQPAVGTATPKSSRNKIVAAALALAVLAALVGGGIGGLLGYRLAANGGHLGSVSAAASQTAVEQVAGKLLPGVVQIRTSTAQQSAAGSGMILSPDGLILTNNHVVDMVAGGGQMSVLLADGRSVNGKIVARDKDSDIALVQAQNVSGLTTVNLGDSSSVQIGQTVIAVGSPLGLGGTVTSGIVSALGRAVSVSPEEDEQPPPGSGLNLPPGFSLPPGLGGPSPSAPPPPSGPPEVLDAIQTDAAINPGNSGGPLIDLNGNVVGINTAIASIGSSPGDQSGSVGIGFSIPINQAKRIMQQLRTTGHVTKALLGVSVPGGSGMEGPPGSPVGAQVKSVEPGEAADKAGVKVGDIIVKVDSRPVLDGDDLIAAMRAEVPGATVTLTLSTGRTVRVMLGESKPS